MRGALYDSHLFPWDAEYEIRFRAANYRYSRRQLIARGLIEPEERDKRNPTLEARLNAEERLARFIEDARRSQPPVPVVATLDGRTFREELIEGSKAFGYERGEFVTRVPVTAGVRDFRISYPHVAAIDDPRDNVMEDERLFRLADERRLTDPAVLRAETLRMLADPKARTLVTDFAAQRLQLRGLDRAKPDPMRFPTVDDELRDAMRTETELFLDAMVREDRSVLDLLDAPFTFVNGPLARHYGIPGVDGEAFQKVALHGPQRGGLLSHASVLTVSSYPTRTSPVLRGKWVLENLLGAPPPEPPADVPALEAANYSGGATLREQMEAHRTNPSCAVCHNQIDPIGFGLEKYDAAGAWRTHEGDAPIDDTGVLPDGTAFRGPLPRRAVRLLHGEAARNRRRRRLAARSRDGRLRCRDLRRQPARTPRPADPHRRPPRRAGLASRVERSLVAFSR